MYLQVMLKHVEPLSEGQILGIYQLQQSVQESVVWIPSDSENPDKKNHNSFIGFEYFKYLWVKIPLKSRLFDEILGFWEFFYVDSQNPNGSNGA